jgi:hypothetical protein
LILSFSVVSWFDRTEEKVSMYEDLGALRGFSQWGGAYLCASMPAFWAVIRLALRAYFAKWLHTPRKKHRRGLAPPKKHQMIPTYAG